MTDLFRKQAVDHAYKRLEGRVLIATSVSTKVLGLLLLSTIAIGSLFACTASYARKETVSGWVVPPGGLIRITALQGGRVESLEAVEGMDIAQNQTVATLGLSSHVDGADSGMVMVANLDIEQRASVAQAAAEFARIAASTKSLGLQRQVLQEELEEAQSRIILLEQRQKNAEAALARGQPLAARGIMNKSALENLENGALSAVQATSSMRSTVLGLSRQIEDVDRQLMLLPLEKARIEAQTMQAQASLAEKRVTAKHQNIYGAAAPISGTVVAVPVERGQTVPAGATLAVIAPASATLIAELYVPSRAAGFIKPGQHVNLMHQAFPYQRFGMGSARVLSVSHTVMGPGEVRIPGFEPKEPVFRVRAHIDEPTVAAYGEKVPLRPGMLLTADIVIDRRTLLEWLLDPLYAGGRRL